MRNSLRAITTIGALLAVAVPATTAAQEADDFQWRGRVAAGQTIEIRGVNGDIRAVASDGDAVEVRAEREGRRSDPRTVRIEVVEHDDGITICAVYPTPRDAERDNECRPGGGPNSVRNNDVQVDFMVRVPAGVEFSGHTVNGDIDAQRLGADVEASTVNGDVEVSTSGFAQARSVNGSLLLRLGRSRLEGDVQFETVNGSITIEMPEGLDADFSASTVNGSIDSDFPILVSGRVDRRSIRGTIGDGGPELRLSTVNGSIRLRSI